MNEDTVTPLDDTDGVAAALGEVRARLRHLDETPLAERAEAIATLHTELGRILEGPSA